MSSEDKGISSFADDKAAVLRFAALLERAQTPAELRALMLADNAAPWHSFNLFELAEWPCSVGDRLTSAMLADLDEDGAPL